MNPTRNRLLALAVVALALGATPASNDPAASDAGPAGGFLALSGDAALGYVLPADVRSVRTLRLEAYGLVYDRYQQHYGEAQVLGGQVTLFRKDSGATELVIGAHVPDIAASNAVLLTDAQAVAVASDDVGPAESQIVDLMIDPRDGHYFYRVESRSFASRWFHWIDAGSGEIRKRYDGVMRDHGIGVKGDTKSLVGPDATEGTADDLSTDIGGAWWLTSADRRQTTLRAGSRRTDEDNHWDDDDHPGQVDAQFYANVTDDYLQTVHGLDFLECSSR